MKDLLLIFLTTVLILSLGLIFGFGQIDKSYEISDTSRNLSIPFNEDFDVDFIRERSF